jgi:hypothetical protein
MACDNRINLYPAAPIRLAKVLLAWTFFWVDLSGQAGTLICTKGHAQHRPRGNHISWTRERTKKFHCATNVASHRNDH